MCQEKSEFGLRGSVAAKSVSNISQNINRLPDGGYPSSITLIPITLKMRFMLRARYVSNGRKAMSWILHQHLKRNALFQYVINTLDYEFG